MTTARTTSLVAVLALACVGIGAGGYAVARGDGTTTAADPPAQNLSIHQISDRTRPGVVEVTGTQTGTTRTPFGAVRQKSEVVGSGFVTDTSGHVVTNYHVVRGTTGTKVTFA